LYITSKVDLTPEKKLLPDLSLRQRSLKGKVTGRKEEGAVKNMSATSLEKGTRNPSSFRSNPLENVNC